MSEVQQNNGGEGGKKNKQKKENLRVDFTPMVDMNMLLITFFMLCSTLLKPQTMNINMPAEDEVKEEEKNKVRQSGAVTLLLGADNELYYYEGMIADDGSSYDDPEFLKQTTYGEGGIRDYLIQRNAIPYAKIQELKIQKANLEITDEEFNEMSKEIQDKSNKEDLTSPTLMIKPTDLSSYENFVTALDEMLICNIGFYAVVDVNEGDRYLLFKKTDNRDYLTDTQRADLDSNE